MQVGIHDSANDGYYISRAEGRAVRETQVPPEHEIDAFPVIADRPGRSQLGLQLLRLTVKADQHAAGEKADGIGRFLFSEQRIERLRICAEAEPQCAPRLGRSATQRREYEHTRSQAYSHVVLPDTAKCRLATTRKRNRAGASIHGDSETR